MLLFAFAAGISTKLTSKIRFRVERDCLLLPEKGLLIQSVAGRTSRPPVIANRSGVSMANCRIKQATK
jgi:hypothetical protein